MKRQRMRRAYLKKLSSGYINTGTTPNREILKQYSERAAFREESFNKLAGVGSQFQNDPRVDALKRRDEFMRGADLTQCIKISVTDKGSLFLYFKKNYREWWFIRVYPKSGKILKSFVYESREQAMQNLKAGTVMWMHTFEMYTHS